jgi:4-diphosphocytidyl-2-C-methyl-D-erythritol kinase
MEETAYAKINLALHVRGREPDGYHRIETVFAFAEDGDRLHVAEGEGLELKVAGPFAQALPPASDNLVLHAAEALRGACAVSDGAALTLTKRLPVAAGLGGGSADAAAALRLLSRWWRLDLDGEALLAVARALGADVAACIGSRTAMGKGRGDALAPAPGPNPAGTPILLVNPGIPLSTPDIFRLWDGRDRGALPDDWRVGRNDLEPVALASAPEIQAVLDALRDTNGAGVVRMSGSGATCFALYADEADRDAAAAVIAARHPGWWRLASRLR